MNLEQIVTSYSMSKKLEEAGFKAETCFWWKLRIQKMTRKDNDHKSAKYELGYGNKESFLSIPAYSFQQLFECMPEGFHMTRMWAEIVQSPDMGITVNNKNVELKHLPDSIAELVLWCIENNYIKLDK